MRILLVGDYPNDPRLGSAKVPHKLAEEFRLLGYSCDLLFAEDLGSRPQRMHARQFAGPWLAERAIRQHFAKNGPYDVVDIASGDGMLFGLQHCLGAYRDTTFISRSHGLEHLNYRRMLDDHRDGLLSKPWTRRLWYPAVRLNQVAVAARTSDRMLVLNSADRDYAVQRGWKRSEHIGVIGHGVSSRFLKDVPPADTPRGAGILYCGTWTGTKGVDYLVPAVVALIDDGAHVNLTILGGGVPQATIRAAFPSHVQNHLTIIDRVSEEEVMTHYRKHDVLVFPSTYEGFGMVLLEAMSQRLPVIATPVGCARQFIHDGFTGILVPSRNSTALALALRQLLDNKDLRSRLAENAFSTAQSMTWSHAALTTLAWYRGEGAAKASEPMVHGGQVQVSPDYESRSVGSGHRAGPRAPTLGLSRQTSNQHESA